MLSEGGFGIVYKAEHEDWGTVAYKELKSAIIKPETKSVSHIIILSCHQFVGSKGADVMVP